VGRLVIESATQGNYPMVQGAVLLVALVYVAVNALIDLSYGYLDPRTRHARA
jgi:peptide/nickel transport system permease protein